MSGAVLRVGGLTAGLRRFLGRSRLKPHRVYIKGKPASPGSKTLAKRSYFLVMVSNADGDEFSKQHRDAARFLRRNMLELRSLPRYRLSGVIDFGVYDTRSYDNPMLSWRFSPSLLALFGQAHLDAEVSIYNP